MSDSSHEFSLPLTPGQAVRLPEVVADLDQAQAHENTHSRLTAAALGVVGVGIAGAVVAAEHYGFGQITHSLPFIEQAQQVVTHVEDGLEPVGEVGIPLSIMLIAAVKAAAPHSNKAQFADSFSSREPSADGGSRRRRFGLRRNVGMAIAGAALATLTASVSTEIGHGPDRPISEFNAMVPGDALIVQYPQAMPMVQSGIAPSLQKQIRAEADRRAIATHGFALNLGSYTYNGKSYTDLFAGVETSVASPLHWNGEDCEDVPAIIDDASGASKGATLFVNGIRVKVIGTTSNASSMNRISGVMDKEAVKTCLAQNADEPDYGMSLETDAVTAQSVLDVARAEIDSDAPAVVITKDQEKANSELFWDENVKPITGVLSLAALSLAAMAMASSMGSRLLRNRRELGARLAQGVSVNTIRAAELLRSAKDGAYAGLIGAFVGIPLSLVPNAIQHGLTAGAGERELAIGAGVGLLGSVGGALLKLVGLKKLANPEETTRV